MNGAVPIMNDHTTDKYYELRCELRRRLVDTPQPTPGAPIVMRFATLGGATVVVTDHPDRADGSYRNRWECLGCLAGSPPHRGDLLGLKDAREKANTHAAGCRALPPLPAPQTRRGEDLR
jgi:hypothetical protein